MLKERIDNKKPYWNASSIKSLRKTLKMSQSDFSKKLGIRQQTVSEWETGAYLPRGGSLTLLNMIAENIEASLYQNNENISGTVHEKNISNKNFKVKETKTIKKISQIYYSNVSSSNNSQMLPI
jgi:DNA-binding XRE family transcriptional regulator